MERQEDFERLGDFSEVVIGSDSGGAILAVRHPAIPGSYSDFADDRVPLPEGMRVIDRVVRTRLLLDLIVREAKPGGAGDASDEALMAFVTKTAGRAAASGQVAKCSSRHSPW